MGMSMHVEAIRPGDGKWEQMKAIWDACEAGAVPVPAEVVRFFNNERPDPAGAQPVSERALREALCRSVDWHEQRRAWEGLKAAVEGSS